jgi:hypothetical protein
MAGSLNSNTAKLFLASYAEKTNMYTKILEDELQATIKTLEATGKENGRYGTYSILISLYNTP